MFSYCHGRLGSSPRVVVNFASNSKALFITAEEMNLKLFQSFLLQLLKSVLRCSEILFLKQKKLKGG